MVESALKTTTFCYKCKWNLYSYSQTLTLLFKTYTIYPSNVPIFLCWHQLRSLWVTLQYQCDHFLQPQRVEFPTKHRKEKRWESRVRYKLHFLFFNDHPKDTWLNLLSRRLHSATNLNEIYTVTLRLVSLKKYIQVILLTYPSCFVDISSVLNEQPYNTSLTIFCSCKKWSVLQNIEKKNNEKVL